MPLPTLYSDVIAALKLRVPEAMVLHRRQNGDSVPLRKRFLKCLRFPLRFQEYGLRTTPPFATPPDWLGTYLWWW
jgi:hypothetical protein